MYPACHNPLLGFCDSCWKEGKAGNWQLGKSADDQSMYQVYVCLFCSTALSLVQVYLFPSGAKGHSHTLAMPLRR